MECARSTKSWFNAWKHSMSAKDWNVFSKHGKSFYINKSYYATSKTIEWKNSVIREVWTKEKWVEKVKRKCSFEILKTMSTRFSPQCIRFFLFGIIYFAISLAHFISLPSYSSWFLFFPWSALHYIAYFSFWLYVCRFLTLVEPLSTNKRVHHWRWCQPNFQNFIKTQNKIPNQIQRQT